MSNCCAPSPINDRLPNSCINLGGDWSTRGRNLVIQFKQPVFNHTTGHVEITWECGLPRIDVGSNMVITVFNPKIGLPEHVQCLTPLEVRVSLDNGKTFFHKMI